MVIRSIRLCEMRRDLLLKHFREWKVFISKLLQGKECVSMDQSDQSVLGDYKYKLENRYNLDRAIEEIYKISHRIDDMNPERSLGLIIGLIAEETLSHVLSNTLESMMFKDRYFYWVDRYNEL